jgi:hypothetical protein
MESFYLTLPSNVKNESYNNTVANFKTRLANRFDLKGDWEVAITEASYTYSWYNINSKEYIQLVYYDGTKVVTNENKIEITPSRYENIDDLLKFINEQMKSKFSNLDIPIPEIKNNEQLKRVYIDRTLYRKISIVHLKITAGLCSILGISKKHMDNGTTADLLNSKKEYEQLSLERRKTFSRVATPEDLRYWSGRPFDFATSLHSLFVYCDIVKHGYVGDSFSQLLRILQIPSKAEYGNQVVLTYSNPQYLPLLINEFESVEIHIKDDTNRTVPFQFGRSIFTLHFRKR